MTTTTADVATIEPSGAPVKRKPPLSIMLNEMLNEVDFSEDGMIYMWSDGKLEIFNEVFMLLDFFGDRNDALLEALYGKASSPEEKRKAREWQRRHSQRIKNARKRLSAIKHLKARNNRKKGLTPTGKIHKKKNTVGHVVENGCIYFWGASYQEFLQPTSDRNNREARVLAEAWAKPAPKVKYVVECWNPEKQKTETVDSDLFTIRKCREVRKLLE
jgi:hypothetical protein